MRGTILLAAGGTGGHVFPGLATAAALHAAEPGLELVFVGTADRLEARLVPEAGWPLHTVPAMALRRDPSVLKLPVVLARAIASTRRLILERRGTDRPVIAAVCFGGYTSVPLALAARATGTPLVVHEQNAVLGRANRLSARAAAAVAVAFPAAAESVRRTRTVVTGNPVRPGLVPDARPGEPLPEVRRRIRAEALETFGLEPDRRTLLVFGGSQGAKRINDAVVGSAGRWRTPSTLQVLHATGARTHQETAAAWASADLDGLLARPVQFIERMDLAYAAADLVVCRAGASSLAELTVLGLPSLLVPYPYATDDHQMANARAVEAAGAALVVPDDRLDAQRLVALVQPLLEDMPVLQRMAQAAADYGRPRAAADVAELVLEVSR